MAANSVQSSCISPMYLKYWLCLIIFLEIACCLVWTATFKCPHTLSSLNNKNIFCQSSDMEKSKIKVQLVLVKDSSLFVNGFLSTVPMLLSHVCMQRRTDTDRQTVGVSFLKRASILSDKGSTLMTLLTLPFSGPSSLDTAKLEVRATAMNVVGLQLESHFL